MGRACVCVCVCTGDGLKAPVGDDGLDILLGERVGELFLDGTARTRL